MKKISILLGIALVMLSSCNHLKEVKDKEMAVAFSLDSAKAAIEASNQLFTEALSKGDSASFIARYASDGCLLPPNRPKVCGAMELGQFFSAGMKMGIGGIKLSTGDVSGNKDQVVEIGTFELMDKAGKTIDKGKFMVLWKQENDNWKMYRDIFNSDMPLPPAAPAKK